MKVLYCWKVCCNYDAGFCNRRASFFHNSASWSTGMGPCGTFCGTFMYHKWQGVGYVEDWLGVGPLSSYHFLLCTLLCIVYFWSEQCQGVNYVKIVLSDWRNNPIQLSSHDSGGVTLQLVVWGGWSQKALPCMLGCNPNQLKPGQLAHLPVLTVAWGGQSTSVCQPNPSRPNPSTCTTILRKALPSSPEPLTGCWHISAGLPPHK